MQLTEIHFRKYIVYLLMIEMIQNTITYTQVNIFFWDVGSMQKKNMKIAFENNAASKFG